MGDMQAATARYAAMFDRWIRDHPELAGLDVPALLAAIHGRTGVSVVGVLQRGGPELDRARAAGADVARCLTAVQAAGVDVGPLRAAIDEREAALIAAVGWAVATALVSLVDPGPAVAGGGEIV